MTNGNNTLESHETEVAELAEMLTTVDLGRLNNEKLKQLMMDVRNEKDDSSGPHGNYDRAHNRHNR